MLCEVQAGLTDLFTCIEAQLNLNHKSKHHSSFEVDYLAIGEFRNTCISHIYPPLVELFGPVNYFIKLKYIFFLKGPIVLLGKAKIYNTFVLINTFWSPLDSHTLISYFTLLMSSVLFLNVENSNKDEKVYKIYRCKCLAWYASTFLYSAHFPFLVLLSNIFIGLLWNWHPLPGYDWLLIWDIFIVKFVKEICLSHNFRIGNSNTFINTFLTVWLDSSH